MHKAGARFSLVAGVTAAAASSLLGAGAAQATPTHRRSPMRPVDARVFSPAAQGRAGAGGIGFVVDVSLSARTRAQNSLLSAAAGYKPFFNDPAAATFVPGADQGAPGLVVMMSSTPTMPGTPFAGPRTNLAGLFQINSVGRTSTGLAQTWNTWEPGKPLFGTGRRTLTVYAVRGTAPAVVPAHGLHIISNIVRRTFTIGQ